MNGDITLEAFRQRQRASKVISPFTIFVVFHYSFLHLYLLFYYRGSNVDCRKILVT